MNAMRESADSQVKFRQGTWGGLELEAEAGATPAEMLDILITHLADTDGSASVYSNAAEKTDRDILATRCECSVKLFSTLRFGTLLVIAFTTLSGYSIEQEL